MHQQGSNSNLNSKVGNGDATLLPEMESDNEGELSINCADSIPNSGFGDDDF
ncbi:hypothetical protein TSUD_220870 [Trifolium subterraneum]|uniref:Uncharacterized protein n=1 Tax=Trifolium subterraneum TaxID=3900 RepID=A0A2Z6NM68_TRISU|nr:hypothetical protein TSUD_220870 [Trifolium subterraneum]